ncbi:hypothetical protein QTO05_10880 [Vibrio fortis]|uniref:hypothetical protein n=1 Tax=Vibrio fortis TaxID=212667 RepID=UPI002F4129C6
MFRKLVTVSLITMLTGCVLYPTTRDYYKPIVQVGQAETASSGCGYHKAKYDALEQTVGDITVRVYPSLSSEKTLMVNFGLASSQDNDYLILNNVISNDVQLNEESESLTLTSKYLHDGVYRTWYSSNTFQLTDNPNQLTVSVSDSNGKMYQFMFEFTTQSDIYYASINC